MTGASTRRGEYTRERMFEQLRSAAMSWSLDAAGLVWKWRYERKLAEAPDENEALLLDILRENANTVFGQAHRFSLIKSPEAWARNVPLRDYEGFRDLVQRIADGEANVLTAEPVRYLGVTSGTTGRGKLVPVTSSAQRQVIFNMMLTTQGVVASSLEKRKPGPGLLLMSAVLPQVSKGGIPIGTATAGGLDRMKGMAPLLWSSPVEVFQVRSHPTAMHLHVLFALARRDLASLTSPFASSLVDFLRTLEADGAALCDELERGHVPELPGLEPEVRARLHLAPDPARAAEVREELALGPSHLLPRLWPDLGYAMTVVTGSFAVYEDALRRALGEVPLYSPLYACSEGFLGLSLDLHGRHYVLDPEAAFFEFIPVELTDEKDPLTVTMRGVKPGRDYELVLTTRSGLYRYRLGDVVRVEGFRGRSPVVAFLYRRGQLLDVASEKTSEVAMREAVLESVRHWGASLVEYATAPDYLSAPNRYDVFFELEDPAPVERHGEPWHTVDAALRLANPGYGVLRSSNRLAPPTVHVVSKGTFRAVLDLLVSQGASPVQAKVPRVLSREDVADLVRSRVLRTWAAPGHLAD
ncbi:MAG: GH3 auxin-responsive promoter family protein [Myxococcota bacterium]